MKKGSSSPHKASVLLRNTIKVTDKPDGTPVPKVQNPEDPNKYQIVSVMDVCSKIFSRILHGTKHQYGATPNCGCQDGNFTLKPSSTSNDSILRIPTWFLLTWSKPMTHTTMS
jgi:hypothetical protein